jgi:hypothetical protein
LKIALSEEIRSSKDKLSKLISEHIEYYALVKKEFIAKISYVGF